MLVGVAGPARAGKGEAANALIYSNYGFLEYSFAAPMRQFVINLLGLKSLTPYSKERRLDTLCRPLEQSGEGILYPTRFGLTSA